MRWWPFAVPWPCWPRGHEPELLRERDAAGRLVAVEWVCRKCRRRLGNTVLFVTTAPREVPREARRP